MLVYAIFFALGVAATLAPATLGPTFFEPLIDPWLALACGSCLIVGWRRFFWVRPLAALILGIGVAALHFYFLHPRLAHIDLTRPVELVADVRSVEEGSAAPDGGDIWDRLWLRGATLAQDELAYDDVGMILVALRREKPDVVTVLPETLVGARVHLQIVLRRPSGPHNRGLPDREAWFAANGIVLEGNALHVSALARLEARPTLGSRIAAAIFRARRWIYARTVPSDTESRALFHSLVLGDRAAISNETEDAFRVTGVTHILSVSGLHLAAVAWLVFALAQALLVRTPLARRIDVSRVAAGFTIFPVLTYTAITGAQIATVRAALMAVVLLFARAIGRPIRGQRAFAFALIATLAFSPYELFDASFELSMMSVAACLWLAPLGRPVLQTLARRWLRFLLQLFFTSVVVFVCTLPICLYHFQTCAPMSVLTNLWAIPFGELIVVPVGLVAALSAVIGLPGHHALLQLAVWLCDVFRVLILGASHFTPTFFLPTPSPFVAALYYATVTIAFLPSSTRRLALFVAGCAWLSLTTQRLLVQRFDRTVAITFVDVGQGDAAIVSLPRGHTIVIDGGGSQDSRYDPGRTILGPLLRSRGVGKIDLVVLSHPHPDHANGLPTLLQTFDIGAIWDAGQPSALPALATMRTIAQQKAIPWLAQPRVAIGDVRLDALHPRDADGNVRAAPFASDNDNSLVLRLDYASRRVLFAGDIEWKSELALARRGVDPVDILKVPHHGSATSSSSFLLHALRPRLAVISVGARNHWGFPQGNVVARLNRTATIFRTDRDGAVDVAISADGTIAVEPSRGDHTLKLPNHGESE